MKNKMMVFLLSIIMLFNLITVDVQAITGEDEYGRASGIGDINIISTTNISVERAQEWARGNGATQTFISLAPLYEKYAKSRGGINWAIAYVQAAKETGYGRFGDVLDESYHNPCGLKNPTGGDDYDPDAHKKFDNWDQGVIAHLDHLALYAGAQGYPKTNYVDKWKDAELMFNETYDPRHLGWYSTSLYGISKTINSLGGNWAPSLTYGIELFRMYCGLTNTTYLPAISNIDMPTNNLTITNNTLSIDGWALHAFGIKEVKVFVDDHLLGNATLGVARADVNSAYPGYFNGSNSGFSGTFDLSNLSTGTKTVRVEIVANDNSVQTKQRSITISRVELNTKGNLDQPTANLTISNNSLFVRGWVVQTKAIKEVKVSIDGTYLGNTDFGLDRTDVGNAYPQYPNSNKSGFEKTFDISNISNGTKTVLVEVVSADGSVFKMTRSITVKKVELKPLSFLDLPTNGESIKNNTLTIRGWAVHSKGIKEVKVSIDGKYLTNVSIGLDRADVGNAYPQYPNSNKAGFGGTVDISSISNGNRKVTVEIVANDGTIQKHERTINVSKTELTTKGNLDQPAANLTISNNSLFVRGWIVQSKAVKEVRVSIDGTYLGNADFGLDRTDVGNAYPQYPNSSKSGFEKTFDISNISNGTKTVLVEVISADGSVFKMTRSITVKKVELKPLSFLDLPTNGESIKNNTLTIRGWAVHSKGIKEVKVSIDGKYLTNVSIGLDRADVGNAYPQYPNSNKAGFGGTVDISSISNGNRKVTVEIVANDGTIQKHERTINVSKIELTTKGNLDQPAANLTISNNSLFVRGWIVQSKAVKEVRVSIDGTYLGNADFGLDRTDVGNAYPQYPNS
ncbi:Ig-like domain-containing protein, partial [Clostridium celatum]|uniref:Ig-like domain-containing protein n=1 Tax=Clostridium celatum TaxID=36834 RepID=UPI00189B7287